MSEWIGDSAYGFFTVLPDVAENPEKESIMETSLMPVQIGKRDPATPASVNDGGVAIAHLREAAVQLEAVFLSELLKSSGLDGRSGSFGGGIGEAQTTSFLRDLQARQIAESGGVGLAEMIFASLAARPHEP